MLSFEPSNNHHAVQRTRFMVRSRMLKFPLHSCVAASHQPMYVVTSYPCSTRTAHQHSRTHVLTRTAYHRAGLRVRPCLLGVTLTDSISFSALFMFRPASAPFYAEARVFSHARTPALFQRMRRPHLSAYLSCAQPLSSHHSQIPRRPSSLCRPDLCR